jgi:hypothetical protein
MPVVFLLGETIMAEPVMGQTVVYIDNSDNKTYGTVVGFSPYTINIRLPDGTTIENVPHKSDVGYWEEAPEGATVEAAAPPTGEFAAPAEPEAGETAEEPTHKRHGRRY